MKTKKYKTISLLLLVSMFFSIYPTNLVAASSVNVSLPTLAGDVKYSDFFNELTIFINEKVGKDISNETLTNNLKNDDFEKAIAQRELIKNAGASTIEAYASVPEKKYFIDWLLNNTEAMTLFLEDGEPVGTYSQAFDVWFEIWSKDKDSHVGYELKLAVASALRFGEGVPKWYTSRDLVTPYERYEYFKVREAEGKFPTSMKTRTVWEIKNIIDAPVSNWDLDYVRDVIHAGRYNASTKKVNIDYPPYVFDSIYKDENGKPYNVFSASGDQFFGPEATIKDVHKIGGVCGTASKYGSIVNKSFGIAGFLIGQPGHAAHAYYSPESPGKWEIGYDIYSWGPSTLNAHNENEYIPYTNYDNTITRVPYLLVYEDARANEATLHKSMQLKWIANALKDATLAQKVRKIAMETNKWNIDVWRNYIDSMKTQWNEEADKNQIPSSSITVTASSENNPEKAINVLDGNSSTIWHTKYSGGRTYLPQWITLAFDKEHNVDRFVYVPRNGGGNGTVTKYNLYKSLDGEKYELISSGNLSGDASAKNIRFKATNAKYLKFEAIEGVSSYASASEVRVYQSFDDKTISNEEWKSLANSITNQLWSHPEAVYDLFRLIQDFVLTPETSREEYQQYIFNLHEVLNKASVQNSNQKSIVDFLRDKMLQYGLFIADFSFDGTNAGKLMGSKMDTEYSFDGGNTWKQVKEDNMKLSDEEIASITAENGIKVRIIGTSDSILIPIIKEPSLPKFYANDSVNKIFNMNDRLFYSVDEGKTWTKYESEEKLPNLSGDVKFMVKIPAQGKTLGTKTETFEFTSKLDTSLILPSDIAKVEADADTETPVTNAYDGNIYSFWHTNYRHNVKPLPQSITFELKNVNSIYKLEYTPRQDSFTNGNITKYNIYSSEDGVNYKLISNGNWAKDSSVKTAEFNAPNSKFIRLEAVEGVGNYASAAEIKLFRNELKIPHVSFSFDGDNAGKLQGSNTSMEYSVDNGKTWKDVTAVNMPLTSEDLMSIRPDTIMQVRFKNASDAALISFSICSKVPNVVGDDNLNTIAGLDNTMEYSVDGGVTWTRYNGTMNVNLNGNLTLHVRTAAKGTTFAGCEQSIKYTSKYANDFQDRVLYKIINKATGRSMAVNYGSTSENAEIIQYGYDGGTNELAYLVSVGENEYKIVMKNSNKVLSPQKLSPDENVLLAQTTYNELPIQKWKLVDLGNNEYQIVNVATGYAITANSDYSKITNSKLNYSNNQTWTVSYAQHEVIPQVSFSFDGENAGKIVGSNNTMEYSIDGGTTWKGVTGDNMLLPDADLASIKVEYGIKIRVKGNVGIAKINMTQGPEAPKVTADDNLNVVKGIDSSMEYSIDNGQTWKRYSETNAAKFMTDMSVLVRIGGKGTTVSGKSVELKFTASFTTDFHSKVSYKIINKATGKSFDVAGGSYNDGATILQWGYGAGENQQWLIDKVDDDSVKIYSKLTLKAFTSKDMSTSEGVTSTQTTFNNLDIQKWKMISLGNNEYQIINKATGLAVTASNTSLDITQTKFVNSPNQTWTIGYTFDEVIPEVSFSFDGENSGKIMGSNNSMEYSIDGGTTWKRVTGDNMLIPNADLTSINAENDIKVKVKDNSGVAIIDIVAGPEAPKVIADDKLNIIQGIDASMEYSIDGGKTWTKYLESNVPKFANDETVLVRIANKEKTLPSKNAELKFTNEVIPQVSFSFDGENAGKIVGSNNTMEYSIDGGTTWKGVTGDNMLLPNADLASIKVEYGIKIRVKGNVGIAKINMTQGPEAPKVTADDNLNVVKGIDSSMEYSIDSGKTWTKCLESNVPKFANDETVLIRVANKGTTVAGKNAELKFTKNAETNFTTNFENRVYYKIINKATGKAFDVAGGFHSDGIGILQWGYAASENQQWFIDNVGDDSVKIYSRFTLKAFTPKDMSTSEGVTSTQTTFNNSDIQKWKIVSLGNNEYQIINKETGLAATAANNSIEITHTKLVNSPNQTWTIGYTFDEVVPKVSFSFDGENAGKIMGSKNSMEYSIDGGATWKGVTGDNMLLPNSDLDLINGDKDIKVKVKGNVGTAKIDIINGTEVPKVTADDNLNVIQGINSSMEYSRDDGKTWTIYSETNAPKFIGDVNVLVRTAGKGLTMWSKNVSLKFTLDFQRRFENRAYYKIVNKATGKGFDVAGGSHSDGARILQWGYAASENQQWFIDELSDDSAKIYSRLTLKAFTPKDMSTSEGAISTQTTFKDLDIQKWNIVSLGNNEYQIINKATGLAATAPNNSMQITHTKLVNSPNQTWIIQYTFDEIVPEVSFSFDGENAGKIMGSNNSMEYTIDGGITWKGVTGDNMLLPTSDLALINSTCGIKVKIKGNPGTAKIDVANR